LATSNALVVLACCRAEGVAVSLAQLGLAAHGLRHAGQAAAHLACVEQRTQALCPQVVVGAVPTVPALQGDVQQPEGVACQRLQPHAHRQAIAEAVRRLMAAGAGQVFQARQARILEQHRAEADGSGFAGHAVRRIARRLGRPGTMRQDARQVVVAQR
jgi:hypothetical protein